ELQLLRGSLGRLHADARPPGELLNGGWSRPAEEALTQCARHYRVVHGGQFQPPARVAVSLLVEASVDRYAPDRSFALQLAERERQRGRDAALLTRLAEVLHGRPQRVLELGGIERLGAQGVDHLGAELVDLGILHAEKLL